MKSISGRYKEIFKKYYHDAAKDRYTTLVDAISSAARLHTPRGYLLVISESRLAKAVDSYYLDVIRYKEYHFDSQEKNGNDFFSDSWVESVHKSKLINDSKVASLTAKWLLKYNPISIVKEADVAAYSDSSENADSAFLASDLLDDDCHFSEKIILDITLIGLLRSPKKVLLIPDDIFDSLYYDFKFRQFDERSYFSRFDLIVKLVEAKEELSGLRSEYEHGSDSKAMKKVHKVFVASAEDVVDLRKSTRKVVDNLNKGLKSDEFKLWMWEYNKENNYYNNPDDYQKAVFEEFGEDCDIFIILFWYRLGEGTINEYEHYKNVFKKNAESNNKKIKFIACQYAKQISLECVTQNTIDFKKWIEAEKPHWAALGGRWGIIKNSSTFEDELRASLLKCIG